MVFKFYTFDLTQDVDVSTLFSPPTSPSSTICLALGKSFTRAVAVAGRVTEGASLGFTAPAVQVSCWGLKGSSDDSNLQLLQPQVQLRKFSFQELKVATSNFSEENVLGHGGFGKVYRGLLLDGTLVAIKRCVQLSGHLEVQGHAEVQVGSMARHRNLIQILGFCDSTEPQKPVKKRKARREPGVYLLVYPLAVNGNVASHLRESSALHAPLDWPTRMHIALGVARGLSYLHEECCLQIIHRDIKPSNILLDENFEPLIGDFGLAKFMDHGDRNQQIQKLKGAGAPHLMDETKAVKNHERPFLALYRSVEFHSTYREISGTVGYMPPEYMLRGELSAKNDVFAFGMVLLNLLSGFNCPHRLWDQMRYFLELNELAGLIDPSLRGDYDENEAEKLVKLAVLCIQSSPTKRPTMSMVVQILKGSSLDDRWESEKEEIVGDLCQVSSDSTFSSDSTLNFSSFDLVSASHLDPVELSGPR